MQSYELFRMSISDELMAVKNRVRNIIGESHWGEEGRYKEIILSKILKEHLPSNVRIGTGFVICEDSELTRQIDIIIYKNDTVKYFEIDNFVVVPAESVYAIIEVKSNLSNLTLIKAIKTAHENGKKINSNIFNGIFSYENATNLDSFDISSVSNFMERVNHIALGKDHFVKYWEKHKPETSNNRPHYSTYYLKDLAFGYFISNLIEHIKYRYNDSGIPKEMEKFLYPIEEGKEARRLPAYEIEL